MPMVRTNITLPAETLAVIDEVAGPRGRSAYIAEVLLKQAKRDRMKKVWEEHRGALKDSEAWGRTPEETLRILREVRASWDRPDLEPPADVPADVKEPHAVPPGHNAPDRPRREPSVRDRARPAPVRGDR
jgi:hypothetical protein